MTINELRNNVQMLANQHTFGSFSPEDFNNAVALANEEYFNEMLSSFARDQKDNDNLNVLKKRVSINIGALGRATKPADYSYGLKVVIAAGTNQKEVEVEILADANWSNRTTSALISTSEYPICRIDNDEIQTEGITDNRIILYYLRRPTKPVWGYTATAVSGSIYPRAVYDPGNTTESDFQNSPTAMRTIMFKTSQFIGIPIQRTDLVQFGASKEQ